MIKFFKVSIVFILLCFTCCTFAQEGGGYSSRGSRGKQKPLCLIYGNCQLSFVYEYLKANFPHKYEYQIVTNYLVTEGVLLFPVDLATQADLFIYQPLQGHGVNDTDYIINNYLKKTCRQISSPYLYFLGYFPDFAQDPRNEDTMSPKMPFGIFPYGSQRLMDLIAQGNNAAQIIERSYGDDFIQKEQIFEKLYKSLSILRDKERHTDIKLADFIEMNYQKHQLFFSVNHPTNYLLEEFIRQILTHMHLSIKAIKKNFLFKKEFFARWTNGIIYPCVAKTLNLQFDISHVIFKREMVFYPFYIAEYIRQLYPEHFGNQAFSD